MSVTTPKANGTSTNEVVEWAENFANFLARYNNPILSLSFHLIHFWDCLLKILCFPKSVKNQDKGWLLLLQTLPLYAKIGFCTVYNVTNCWIEHMGNAMHCNDWDETNLNFDYICFREKLQAQNCIRDCEKFLRDPNVTSESLKEGVKELMTKTEDNFGTLLHLERVCMK